MASEESTNKRRRPEEDKDDQGGGEQEIKRKRVTALELQLNSMMITKNGGFKNAKKELGLNANWFLDLSNEDTKGRTWDFSDANASNRVLRKVLEQEPQLVIASGMCPNLESLMTKNFRNESQSSIAQDLSKVRQHISCCAFLYFYSSSN